MKYGWFSLDMLSTMIAVAESTPGPIGVNMATYIGNVMNGPMMGVVTTLSLVAPSFLVILMVSRVLEKFQKSRLVQNLFYGLRPAVVALILSACLSIFVTTFVVAESMTFNIVNGILFIILMIVYKKMKLNPIVLIFICALLGVVLGL
jgi:chromate transporter